MQSISLEPILSPLWLLAIAIGLLAMVLLGPSFSGVSPRKRFSLSMVRTLSIFVVLTLLVRPGCVTRVEKQQTAVLLLMMDFSRSMELAHKPGGMSRWEKMRQMVAQSANKLEALRDQNIVVRLLGYDNQVNALDVASMAEALTAQQPSGAETDIGSSLDEGIKSVRGQRLMGVILAGDGVQNVLDPRVELARSVERLVDVQVPLYTVPFGPVADTGQFADISIENMPDNFTGFVKNQQNIRVTFRARGFTNQNIPVQLVVTDQSGEETIVETKSISVERENQTGQIDLRYTPTEPGNYRLSVRVPPQPREVSSRNNELSAFMTVYDGGLRVLYLHGDFSPEAKFIRWALGSSGDIELISRPILSRNRGNWPLNLESTFSDEKYDVFILGNVDSRALYRRGVNEGNMRALVRAVENGRGLIMLGGYQSFGPGMYHQTPLRDLLPIQMDVAERQDPDGPIETRLHLDRPMSLMPTGPHYLLRLNADDEVDAVWRNLPKLPGANKFRGVKGTAQVLLESEFGQPILVGHNVGGRVLAFAGDATWQWYLAGFREAHKRFWRQVVLWLAFRDGLTNDNVWINLPQRRFEPGGLVEFSVGAKTAAGDTIDDAQFQAELTSVDGNKTPIAMTRSEGKSWAQIPRELVKEPGLYTITVAANRDGESIGQSSAQFMVFDRDREKANPAGDPAQLARMAQATREFGGRMIRPEEFGTLIDDISNNPPDLKIVVPKKWRLGDTLFDGLIVLFVFVGLLTTEWFLRKKWGLV